MSKLSHTLRRFNRFELKYLISLKQADIFKKALRAYLIADEHGNGNGRYALASLYYDSPDLSCYHEKVDGLRLRRKLRIRLYETGTTLKADTPVFVEIKQRLDRVTQKRRVILPYGEALRLCNERQYPENVCTEDEAVMDEIYAYIWQYNLRPVSIVRYERQALIGTDYDLGLRVTFDTSLSYQVHRLQLDEDPSSLPLLSPDRVVMEIKVNERIPYWLTEMIAAHNLRMIRISKYCRSIELANGLASTFSQHASAFA
ncbi:MAG: polyphosphate polymerase domain-containing protein [Anaerolineales bacterium]|nr:polyphosphate polymerase domain-containing protein [Anaerolineales bacterium]